MKVHQLLIIFVIEGFLNGDLPQKSVRTVREN